MKNGRQHTNGQAYQRASRNGHNDVHVHRSVQRSNKLRTVDSRRRARRVVFVTGSAGDIGSAIVKEGRRQGNIVIGTDLCARPAVKHDLYIPGIDLTCEHCAKRGVDTALGKLGRIDVLICNACIAPRDDTLIHLTPPTVARKAVDSNYAMAYNVIYRVLPAMMSRRNGTILLVSSINAIWQCFNQVGYASGKATYPVLAADIAAQYGQYGIRAVVPMLVTTPNDGSKWEGSNGRFARYNGLREFFKWVFPSGRPLSPPEVARNILALASDDLTAQNGDVVPLDFGLLAQGLPLRSKDWRQAASELITLGVPREGRGHISTNQSQNSRPKHKSKLVSTRESADKAYRPVRDRKGHRSKNR